MIRSKLLTECAHRRSDEPIALALTSVNKAEPLTGYSNHVFKMKLTISGMQKIAVSSIFYIRQTCMQLREDWLASSDDFNVEPIPEERAVSLQHNLDLEPQNRGNGTRPAIQMTEEHLYD